MAKANSLTHYFGESTNKCFLKDVFQFTNYFLSTIFQVLEIRPVINWDKGKAVTFLLESLGEFFSVFIDMVFSFNDHSSLYCSK